MGYQALLQNGEIISPAVDVLEGRITYHESNRIYRGVTGTCPHCLSLRNSETDNLTMQAALSVADLSVHYVSACIRGDRMDRMMYFAHRPGFWKSTGTCRLCSDARLRHHAAAVRVIGRWAEHQWPNSTVRAEMRINVKGALPTTFQPDVSIHSQDGKPVACIEYQRSAENFLDFTARHELRLSQFPEVLWFFDRPIYRRSAHHRDYLHDRGSRFFKTWTNEEGRLIYEQGRPVERKRRPIKAALRSPEPCSEANLIRALERQQSQQKNDDMVPDQSLNMQLLSESHRSSLIEHAPVRFYRQSIPQTVSSAEWVKRAVSALNVSPHKRHIPDIESWLRRNGSPSISKTRLISIIKQMPDEAMPTLF